MASINGECPECGSTVPLPEDAVDGEIITCNDCGMDLEIFKDHDTLKVKIAELKGEDWGE
jgi:alpha-aminoadipate carrier protein LysW